MYLYYYCIVTLIYFVNKIFLSLRICFKYMEHTPILYRKIILIRAKIYIQLVSFFEESTILEYITVTVFPNYEPTPIFQKSTSLTAYFIFKLLQENENPFNFYCSFQNPSQAKFSKTPSPGTCPRKNRKDHLSLRYIAEKLYCYALFCHNPSAWRLRARLEHATSGSWSPTYLAIQIKSPE